MGLCARERKAKEPAPDIELVVDPSPAATLLDVAAFADDVEKVLGEGCRVDVSSSRVLPEAVALWS